MGRCRKILSNDTLVTLYFSLIYPHLYYCCIVWAGACATAINKLEVLQNRAVRLITRSPFRSSACPLFKQLHLLKIVDIRKLQIYLLCSNIKMLYCLYHVCTTVRHMSTIRIICAVIMILFLLHIVLIFVNNPLVFLVPGYGSLCPSL